MATTTLPLENPKQNKTYTLADLARAKARTKKLTDSLNRGMVLITPLENEVREANGGNIPEELPADHPYTIQLGKWRDLLSRYEKASDDEKKITAMLKAESQQKEQVA